MTTTDQAGPKRTKTVMRESFQKYAKHSSAVISDGIIPVPIWAVTQMTLSGKFPLAADRIPPGPRRLCPPATTRCR